MSERENILELKNVVYSFHTYGGEVKAVRDVSYEKRRHNNLMRMDPQELDTFFCQNSPATIRRCNTQTDVT